MDKLSEYQDFVKVSHRYTKLMNDAFKRKEITAFDFVIMNIIICEMKAGSSGKFSNKQLNALLKTDSDRLSGKLKRLRQLDVIIKTDGNWEINRCYIRHRRKQR